jgi:hypothetical protein
MTPTPGNDLDPPELLSVSVSPTTVEQGSGSITIDLVAQDASGVNYATIGWLNPSGSWSGVTCQFNGNDTCALTEAMTSNWSGDTRWAFTGNYTIPEIAVYDVNGIYVTYRPNGTTYSPSQGYGTHGFSIPDLTLE